MKKDYFQLISEGYKVADNGYAEDKAIYEHIKGYWLSKIGDRYTDVKVYRTKSDTKGLLAYEVYVK